MLLSFKAEVTSPSRLVQMGLKGFEEILEAGVTGRGGEARTNSRWELAERQHRCIEGVREQT
jgi:hypothetical protein